MWGGGKRLINIIVRYNGLRNGVDVGMSQQNTRYIGPITLVLNFRMWEEYTINQG